MKRIGIIAVMAAAGVAHAAPAPALCPRSAPALVRPAPCRTMPASVSRITGFDPVCRPIVPCNPCEVPCIRPCTSPCDSWLPIGPGVWINGAWVEQTAIVPVGVDDSFAPPAPDVDEAMVDLRAGRYLDAATEFLRRHTARVREELEAAGAGEVVIPDRSALRLHALALAGGRDQTGAARAFAQAYREDPLLEGNPLDGGRLIGSGMELRRILIDAVRSAHRSGSSDAWNAVGRLMQAQGRFERANTMFARADAAS